MANKKKCKCKHKKFKTGKYYFQGEAEEEDRALFKKLIFDGVNVYHQYGKPGTGCVSSVIN